MPSHKRTKHFVDRQVQGALVNGVALYWLYTLIALSSVTVLGWIFVSPGLEAIVGAAQLSGTLLRMFVIAAVTSFLLLPLIVWDMVRLSNRFCGPMFRLRSAMNQLAAGQPVEPIQFREGDYWQEFADAFNAVRARMVSQEAQLAGEEKPQTTAECPLPEQPASTTEAELKLQMA